MEKIKGTGIIPPGEGKTDGWFNNILKVFDQFFQWPAVLYLQEYRTKGNSLKFQDEELRLDLRKISLRVGLLNIRMEYSL